MNEAKGDVARFNAVLGEYRKDPDVVRTRLYYEMYDRVFANADGTDLIDKNLKNFLPLKSMGGAQAPAAAAAPPGAAAEAAPPAPAPAPAPAAPSTDTQPTTQQGGSQ